MRAFYCGMFGVTTSDDYKPVTWMGRFPVDVTTILVGLHIVAAVLTCLLIAFGAAGFLDFLHFDSARVLSGEVWRLVTYAFVHVPSALLWFAIEMYMLFIFGREVEKFIGQRAYIVLYLLLLLAPPIILALWGLGQRTGLAGSPALHSPLNGWR
jgi:membrane associated rhomboid family serine protease